MDTQTQKTILPGLRFIHKNYRGFNLTPKEVLVMISLIDKGPGTLKDMAKRLNTNTNTLHNLTRRMKFKGVVKVVGKVKNKKVGGRAEIIVGLA